MAEHWDGISLKSLLKTHEKIKNLHVGNITYQLN